MTKQHAVYILASRRNGTLTIGVIRSLIQRIYQHKHDEVEAFTRQYGVHSLVYLELHDSMQAAHEREKYLKTWNRAWKITFIEKDNPQWRDLYPDLTVKVM